MANGIFPVMKKLLHTFLVLVLSTAALADHTVTMRTTFEDPAAAEMKMTSVTRTKGKRQRIEDTTDFTEPDAATSGFSGTIVDSHGDEDHADDGDHGDDSHDEDDSHGEGE